MSGSALTAPTGFNYASPDPASRASAWILERQRSEGRGAIAAGVKAGDIEAALSPEPEWQDPVQSRVIRKTRDAVRGDVQSGRWRVAVFVAVVGLHFVVGLLLFAAGTVRISRLRADAPLSLLTLPQENPPQVPSVSPASIHYRKRQGASRDIDRLPNVAEPEPSNAITVPFDLGTDADAAARRQADKEENEKRWRNLAGPSESQLEWWKNNAPLSRDYRVSGDNEHAEGGELITWVDAKCYYTTHGITTFGMPETKKVCKDPFKPKTDLFKDMRKNLDQSAKGRAP